MGVYKPTESRYWYVDIKDQNGKRRRFCTFQTDYDLARRIEKKSLGEVAERRYFPDAPSPLIVQGLIDRYVGWARENGRSGDRARQCGAHILKHINLTLPASDLRPLDIERYQRKRLVEGAAPGTVRRELNVLIAALNHAVREGLIAANPLAGRVRRLKTQPRVRLLSGDEREALLRAAKLGPSHLYPLIVLLLATGLRRTECLSLKWNDVDLEKQVLFVRRGKGDKPRMIPLSQQALRLLQSMPRPGDYVITDEDGKSIGNVKHSFGTACRRAGIENLRLHDLRRSFASELAMRGVSPWVIQQLLGHARLDTSQVYVNIGESAMRRAVNQGPDLGVSAQDIERPQSVTMSP